MFVSVKYFDERLGCYPSAAYTYKTALPLEVGDVVLAPTKNAPEGSRAIVAAVNVDEPKFTCREITKYYTEDENNGRA